MKMKTAIVAFATVCMVATGGAAFAQEPQGGGSGEHGVGAGPDPRAMHSDGMMMRHRMHRRMPMMMHRRMPMMMHRHHHMRYHY